ncbi:formamidopyrimidine-DNA glycosylase [Povalibacter uvarum]|uniref:Formamidopyrimidine-DNA glycosylase n=1 Tax=Povalibacter uvarum TaxID=732238 RepID=A0A841HSJ6_9GAMM|nr:DNA-formamidopyrimidine glycosylase family protein [Povalibacter uvarum]MBB6095279.1 formamidopyrimidine-DNA glycosylase [Povalibacter uvarum]
MPELPDITVYLEALQARIVGQTLKRAVLKNPFLLRSVDPPLSACEGRKVVALRRLGKRIAIGLEGDLWLVIHLMIAGRLHWYASDHRGKMRAPLLLLEFGNGSLTLTEAGTKRRAALHVVTGEAALATHDRGGLEVLEATLAQFRERLARVNHTLKRALTDPTILSGIGNAYSDEILHRARLSPMAQTRQLDDAQWQTLFEATRETLRHWTDALRGEAGSAFPERVTAFHDSMAVHGRYGKPCPVCGTAVQRIRYADNETNYCPRCQTGGKLLADRALSRLLKDDWPRTIEALENQKRNDLP